MCARNERYFIYSARRKKTGQTFFFGGQSIHNLILRWENTKNLLAYFWDTLYILLLCYAFEKQSYTLIK